MSGSRFESIQRALGYVLMGVGLTWLWHSWDKQHHAQQPTAPASVSVPAASTLAHVPQHRLIRLENDVLSIAVDRLGGALVNAQLKAYPTQLHGKQPVTILSSEPDRYYVAQSGIQGDRDCHFQVGALQAHATPDKPAQLTLTCHRNHQLIAKTFTLPQHHYVVSTALRAANQGAQSWRVQPYSLIKQTKPAGVKQGFMQLNTYTGPSYFTPDKHYQKLSYKTIREKGLWLSGVERAWIAVQQRYFLSAWVPAADQPQRLMSAYDAQQGLYTIGMKGPAHTLQPHQQTTITKRFYVGPELHENLRAIAPGLDLTIDYGWLWLISIWLFKGLAYIEHLLGNWGWSIIVLTALIKAVFYRFSASSYRSMARMKSLKPKIEALQKQYGDQREKLAQETMALYKRERVNPMGGCLPILVQIPFFIALYWVLMESVQLRHAPFMLWIHDLSAKDPYYILPIIMGLTMLLQQRMTPATDPQQAQIMMIMPVVFTFMFSQFPAGLVLYWITNNTLSILQQWWVTRQES